MFPSLVAGSGRWFAAALHKALPLLLLVCGGASSQTLVTGPIQIDTRWTLTGSPYVLNGATTVQNNARLTIDAGVTVFMGVGASVDVQAGSVVAVGTAAQPILIRSDKVRQAQTPAPGDWGTWRYSAGASADSRLEHALVEHGSGIVVHGSAPVFNHVRILDHAAPAMAVDLAASPSGVGLQASGNVVNGIAVPGGDIGANVRWGLRGIPYVVTAGTVSVGVSPRISAVSPNVLERAQTTTLTIDGTRLTGYGVASLGTGVTLTPFTGGTASRVFYQAVVAPDAPYGPINLQLQTDAGEIVLASAVTVSPPRPVVNSISPASVEADGGPVTLTVAGQGFVAGAEVLVNAAALPTQFDSTTQLRATLPNQPAAASLQLQVRTPNAAVANTFLESNVVALTIAPASRPVLSVVPTPIALPPNNQPQAITVRLSKPDQANNTITIAVTDPSRATVSPASVVVPAGQTSATFNVTPIASGATTLTFSAPTLQTISVPLFVTVDYRAANTAHAAPVGVVIPVTPGQVTRQVTVADARVGVAVGAVVTDVTPRAWTPGSTVNVNVTGIAMPAGARLSITPNTGIAITNQVVSGDGTQLQAQVTTASDATVGSRRVVVADGTGTALTFVDPSRSTVQILTGEPSIDSMLPLHALRGTTIELRINGRHLQQGKVRMTPEAGLVIDSEPQISADGLSMTVRVAVATDAPLSARTVQVVTPAGATSSAAGAQNTFSIVSTISPIPATAISLPVGVSVGGAPAPAEKITTQGSPFVGVIVGAGIREVAPRVGVVGTDTVVTLRGSGLQGVPSITFNPLGDVSIPFTPTTSTDGTELQFTLRVDAGAAQALRRLAVTINGQRITMSRPQDETFLITAPLPELASVTPQVLIPGQSTIAMTVRGRNLTNVVGVRAEPASGVTFNGPYVATADGTSLSFNATVAAGTASGVRAVIVSTAAGDSASDVSPGNMVRIANQVGATFDAVSGPIVGVVVGAATPPRSFEGALPAPVVGVVVGQVSTPRSIDGTASSPRVGVVVGSAAYSVEPSGWLQGASGAVTVTGRGLDVVTGVSVASATGVQFGTPAANADGSALTFTIAVAPNAPLEPRSLRLLTSSGRVLFVDPAAARFGIGQMPTMLSVAPLGFDQGKVTQLTVRGTNLQSVTGVRFAPDGGVRAVSAPVWAQDALGELLTVSIQVDASAPLGSRVIQLEVPGGITTPTSNPSNTVSVVTPQ